MNGLDNFRNSMLVKVLNIFFAFNLLFGVIWPDYYAVIQADENLAQIKTAKEEFRIKEIKNGEVNPFNDDFKMPAPILTKTDVKPNMNQVVVEPVIPNMLTPRQIIRKTSYFTELLTPIGEKNISTDETLLNLLEKYRKDFNLAPLEKFILENPKNDWALSLKLQLAYEYRMTGYFQKSLVKFNEVWADAKDFKKSENPDAFIIANLAFAEILQLNAWVGRYQELKTLFNEVKDRPLAGPGEVKINQAKEGLQIMETRPEVSFMCGPFAIQNIYSSLKGNFECKAKIDTIKSPYGGFNMAEMLELSKELGLDLIIAKREKGAAVITPALVHWQLNHFGAIVKENGNTILKDNTYNTTYGKQILITTEILDAEASQYFLVPNQDLPKGWSKISQVETIKGLYGKGQPNSLDPSATGAEDAKSGCGNNGNGKGMAVFSIHTMLVSLSISDIPLWYDVKKGPAFSFNLNYSERGINNNPVTYNYANVGQYWTHNFLTFIMDNSTLPTANVQLYKSGGGTDTFTGFNSGTGYYVSEFQESAKLKKISDSPIEYQLEYNDGSKLVYKKSDGGSTSRKVFLSEIIDNYGLKLTINHDSYNRISNIVDASNYVTTFNYVSSSVGTPDFYRIQSVVEPYGRQTVLTYNSLGFLSKITDMVGIDSEFTYNSSTYKLTDLITPYGTTNFSYSGTGIDRDIIITDPYGKQARIKAIQNVSLPAEGTQPPWFDTTYLQFRNTFYWSKKAYDGTLDYSKATIYHFLHGNPNTTEGKLLESMKEPFEKRVFYKYPGQTDNNEMIGITSRIPCEVVQVNDAGQVVKKTYEYNALGAITKYKDPLNREVTFNYYTNNIDLKEVRITTYDAGTNTSVNDKISEYTYNAQHQVLTEIGANAQTTTYTYNSIGQIATATNAKGEVYTFVYYDVNVDGISDGPLKEVRGPNTQIIKSFTYDSFNRVRTITDSNNDVVTYDYDNLDRVTLITYADGTTSQNVYLHLNLVATKDREGKITRYFFNKLQQLVAVRSPEGDVLQYEWRSGGLKRVIDSLGRVTTWNRDIEGRVTSKVYPDGRVASITYNLLGQIKDVTDAKGQKKNYTYYLDGALNTFTHTNTSTPATNISYQYDAFYGRLKSYTDNIGTTNYTYYPFDSSYNAGSLNTVDGPWANDTMQYTYDQLGRAATFSINNKTQSFQYDSLGRLSSTTNSLGLFNMQYLNDTSLVTNVQYPNGLNTQFDYFDTDKDRYLLKELTNYLDASKTQYVSKHEYQYNLNSDISGWNIKDGTGSGQRLEFAYDNDGQLETVYKKALTAGNPLQDYEHYRYDKAGNRTSNQSFGNKVTTAEFNISNQITSLKSGGKLLMEGQLSEYSQVTINKASAKVSGNNQFKGYAEVVDGTNEIVVKATDTNHNVKNQKYSINHTAQDAYTYAFDLNGNLTTETNTTQGTVRTFEWDSMDNLVAINSGTKRSEFQYNAQKQRIGIKEKISGTVVSDKKFIWLGSTLAEQRSADGATLEKEFLGAGEILHSGGNAIKYYYGKDHQGSVREVLDEAKNIVAKYEYTIWGARTKISGTYDTEIGYTCHYTHATSGLDLTHFRAYDSKLGRWLSPEPLGECENLNLYRLGHNSSVNGFDYNGLGWLSSFGKGFGIAALTGLLVAAAIPSVVSAAAFIGGAVLGVGGAMLVVAIAPAVLLGVGIGLAGVGIAHTVMTWHGNTSDENAYNIGSIAGGLFSVSKVGNVKNIRSRGTCYKKELLPDNVFITGKAPKLAQPFSIKEGIYNNNGRLQPWKAYYDYAGRLIARTDYNAGNKAEGIPDVHYHLYEYKAGSVDGQEIAAHIPGEYKP